LHDAFDMGFKPEGVAAGEQARDGRIGCGGRIRTGQPRDHGVQRRFIAKGMDQPLLPARGKPQTGDDRFKHRLVAQRDGQILVWRNTCDQGAGFRQGAGVGAGLVGFAQILDTGLIELIAALAALAEHLAEIGIASRRGEIFGDMGAADRNGEFGPEAEAFAGLGFGQEDAAAQILAGHVEKRLGRLDHRNVDQRRATGVQRAGEFG